MREDVEVSWKNLKDEAISCVVFCVIFWGGVCLLVDGWIEL